MDLIDEIGTLENALYDIEAAIGELQDVPYYEYLWQSWETDVDEIKARLEELYAEQDKEWEQELKQQNIEFERSVL